MWYGTYIFALCKVMGHYSCLVMYELFINFISITDVPYQVGRVDTVMHIELYQLNLALLQQNMCTRQLASCCIVVPEHAHTPAGIMLHCCTRTCAHSSWPHVTLLHQNMCTLQLASCCIIAPEHVHTPAGIMLHYCTGTCAHSSWHHATLLHHNMRTLQLE
jgi:hypothetical protein